LSLLRFFAALLLFLGESYASPFRLDDRQEPDYELFWSEDISGLL
jgi:hypothetical protein